MVTMYRIYDVKILGPPHPVYKGQCKFDAVQDNDRIFASLG